MNQTVDYSRNQVEQISRLGAEVKNTNLKLNQLNERLQSMEDEFRESSKASGRLAFSLNILTGALVLVGVSQIVVTLITK